MESATNLTHKKSNSGKAIAVDQLELDGTFIKQFTSCNVAAKAVKGQSGAISKVCRGKANQHKGFKWQYAHSSTPPTVTVMETIANDMLQVVNKYCVLQYKYAHVVVMWILGTYFIDTAQYFPRMLITSPVPGCGKTQVTKVIESLTENPIRYGDASAAGLYREIEAAEYSVILLEEVDEILKKTGELTSIINNGVEKGVKVLRADPSNSTGRLTYETFLPLVLGGIDIVGKLPPATVQRCITITLRKEENITTAKAQGESIKHIHNHLIQRANVEASIRLSAGFKLSGTAGRSGDVWGAVHAVASLCGDTWVKAMNSEFARFKAIPVDEPENVRLIRTIKTTLDNESMNGSYYSQNGDDYISSTALVKNVISSDKSSWSSPTLTTIKLAQLLRSFDVTTYRKRVGGNKNATHVYIISQLKGLVKTYAD